MFPVYRGHVNAIVFGGREDVGEDTLRAFMDTCLHAIKFLCIFNTCVGTAILHLTFTYLDKTLISRIRRCEEFKEPMNRERISRSLIKANNNNKSRMHKRNILFLNIYVYILYKIYKEKNIL